MSNDMVQGSTISEISNDQPEYTSLNGPYLKFGVDCYEAGMNQVLRGIAEDWINNTAIHCSDYTKKLSRIVEEKRQQIENTMLNPLEKIVIQEYAEAITEANSADSCDYYIQGFLDGYRYLANRIACKSEGYVLPKRNGGNE